MPRSPFALSPMLLALLPGLLVIPLEGHARPVAPGMADFQLAKVTFTPPPGQKAPKQTIGGGRRDSGQCPAGAGQPGSRAMAQPMTALVPSNNLGLTTSDRPTFWAYVPSSSAKTLEFLLEDNRGQELYQATTQITGAPGIVKFAIPPSAPALEVGQDYRWVVSMVCEPAGPRDPFVGAWVRRVAPDPALTNKLKQAKSLDRVTAYATAGVWHDALTELTTLRQTKPNDAKLEAAWKELLQSVGLGAIAVTPLQK